MNVHTNQYRIIDVDTHVVEPYDLWTSRVSSKYGDAVPHVKQDAETGTDYWYFGDKRAGGAGSPAMAGWHEHPPFHPKTLGEAERYTWDAVERLKVMDDYGIQAQVLFPNVIFFDAKTLLKLDSANLMLDCIKAYNDWQTDYASIAPDRFLPQTILPFWDLDETLKELERGKRMGHRGLVFTSEPHFFAQPKLTSPHWDRLWAAAQEMGMPVNFHIGSGDHEVNKLMDDSVPSHADYASMGVLFFMGNASAVTQIICGGICQRFPKLNFVSVESGVGWLPFAVASLDWQWINCGVPKEHADTYDLLPSEYFRRQIYGSFWFEDNPLVKFAIDRIGADNILYETDFPHPTSMSPGPATSAKRPPDYLEEVFAGVPQDQVQKILHDNAARLYGLD
ncbi:amidohydrolase family protein [Flavisphingomonas formosensis]|uniref:amidohydrolase family protein n=1 Tax=Flavisphingomonas formosensis TaxID=861534 RepID=UPI0012F9600A|nr:amidohydrolase family protein [Sphingomonas formosensis]